MIAAPYYFSLSACPALFYGLHLWAIAAWMSQSGHSSRLGLGLSLSVLLSLVWVLFWKENVQMASQNGSFVPCQRITGKKVAHRFIRVCVLCACYAFWAAPYFTFLPEVTKRVDQENGILGKAYFCPRKMSRFETFYQEGWKIEGILRSFENWHNIPVVILLSDKKEPPFLNGNYWIEGRLLISSKGVARGRLRFTPQGEWKKVAGSYNFVGIRAEAKQWVSRFLLERIESHHLSAFLLALVTSEFSDPFLRVLFNRCGLIHLLVISGFHFSFFSLLIQRVLRFFLPLRTSLWATLFLISCYFLFLGNSAAIFRAYLSFVLVITALLTNRFASGCNSWGVCLLAQLWLDPHSVMDLGFHFSYLATAALLVISPFLGRGLDKVIPLLSLDEIRSVRLPMQILYSIAYFLKKSLCITTSVHIVMIPVLLYHLQRASLMGLFTNFYFPILTAFLIFLFLLSLLTSLILPISVAFYPTLLLGSFLLDGVSTLGQIPAPTLITEKFSLHIPLFLISLLFFWCFFRNPLTSQLQKSG